ncbi:MAG: response regulator [Candidatus Binatia bacterium]
MNPPAATTVILVVDDDEYCRDITARLLEREGYRTLQARNGIECLETVAREHVDLVLLDVVMPGMTGFEVIPKLRALPNGQTVPIILLTGRDDIGTHLEGMHSGVSEYLTKPITSHELSARVRGQLHIVGLTRQLEQVERELESTPGRPARSGE